MIAVVTTRTSRKACFQVRKVSRACSGKIPAARMSSTANNHMTRLRRGNAQANTGLYMLMKLLTIQFSSSLRRWPFKRIGIKAGTTVTDRIDTPTSAKLFVKASG